MENTTKISETMLKTEPEVGSGDIASSVAPSSFEWTVAEERKLVRKIDLLIMPLLVFGFIALQLDRGNISSALTDNFLVEVGITQNQFNVGQQLLLAGIIILELPSNLILYRLGPCIWLTAQIIVWGLVATFQAFQKGLAAFLVTRLLLRLTEGGFIPAGLYSITT
ncbi:hypothetical protein QQX98_007774 [Neonectria punicea]|uniref:Major facilitator superfamily (MFS) profile domain-containing protein n=1 Tax=Neonectria punicea TaxID=979145 RepID=A0ABR1GWZ4_9HYPO